VNSLFILLGIEAWKPVVSALVLPPVPLLALLLVGARLMLPRRGLGWLTITACVALLWLSTCTGAGHALAKIALRPGPALNVERIAELKSQLQAKRAVAVVVLGGGMEPFAPEYGVSSLNAWSLERLRYGLWLSRETGAPVAFSGGAGWAQPDAKPEAQIAAQIAAQEFGRPIRWVEDRSHDTRENAARSVALLKQSGVQHVVLVTHGWHMPRAVRAFEQSAAGAMRIEAAPMGLASHGESPLLAWLPSYQGYTLVHHVLHELLGLAVGA
jgi:uncharacterized SAM-binding protein YcdF (DUF218 family)